MMTNNMEMTTINTSRKGKQVRCIETNAIYRSASEAARENGCSHDLISSVCLGKIKTAKGKHFCYVEAKANPETTSETEKNIIVSKPSIVKGKGKCTNGNTNAVLCITDGSVFTSCTDAAEHGNVSIGQMSHTCRNKGTYAKGKQYCYIKDIDQHLDEISDAISKKNAYQELLAKENRRKQLRNMIADYKGDIRRLSDEINVLCQKVDEAELELMSL